MGTCSECMNIVCPGCAEGCAACEERIGRDRRTAMPQWEYTTERCGPDGELCPAATIEIGHRSGGCCAFERTELLARDGSLIVTHSMEDSSQRVDQLHVDLQPILCLIGMKMRDDPEHLVEGGPERWLDEHIGKGMWTVCRDNDGWLAWKFHARKHRGITREQAMARLVIDEMMRSR